MPSKEIVQQLDHTLTTVARNFARREGLPLSRRVHYTEHISHDMRVPRNSRKIFVSTLDEVKVVSLIKDGVTQAARLDHDYFTDEDLRKKWEQTEHFLDMRIYAMKKAIREGDFETAHEMHRYIESSIEVFEELTDMERTV